MELVSPVLAVLAGLLFGLAVHIQRIAVRHLDSHLGAFISVLTMALLAWALSPLLMKWEWWGTRAALLFALCGLAFPAMAQGLSISSVARVGPSATAAIGALWPVFAVVPAVVYLGETLHLKTAVGISIMLFALLLSAVRGRRTTRTWPILALILPLGSAFVRGVVQPVAKIGYGQLPIPYFGMLVMASVSTVVVGLSLLLVKHKPVRGRTLNGYSWFVLNGVLAGAGILIMQFAINLGDIVVVAPLVATTPLWAFLFGVVIFDHEQLGIREAAVAALVVIGSILIIAK